MFSKHVTKNISAYCHGELSNSESQQFAEHLISCTKCRREFEEIKTGIELAQHLPRFSAPDDLWQGMEPLLGSPQARVVHLTAWRYRTRWQLRAGVAAALLLVLGLGVYKLTRSPSTPTLSQSEAFWNVERIDGAPTVASTRIDGQGKLAIGQWLETDANSSARLELSSVGQVKIDPNTRVKLVEIQSNEHRLELAHGKMSAHIWAPPKLFFVTTPSAVAADLGCAYTLEVDDKGGSLLRVTAGWVALQLKDRESMVPAGAACETRPGFGPGTPYFEDASEDFRSALRKIDFSETAERGAALSTVLQRARGRDTLTLLHLLSRVDGADRERVYDKLARFVPPPPNVTREGVLRLDQTMLDTWRAQLEPTWTSTALIKNPVAEFSVKVRDGANRRLNKLSSQ